MSSDLGVIPRFPKPQLRTADSNENQLTSVSSQTTNDSLENQKSFEEPSPSPLQNLSRIASPTKSAIKLAFGEPPTLPYTPRQGSPTPSPTPISHSLPKPGSPPTPSKNRSASSQSSRSETSLMTSHVTGPNPTNISTNAASLELQLEMLRKKLRIMDSKRKEDYDKIIRLQSENKDTKRLESIVKRLQAKLTPMHEEIVNLRDKLQTSDALRAKLVQEAAQQDEVLELAALDREMAEERAENLQEELNELKIILENLETDYEALREENALYEELRESHELDPASAEPSAKSTAAAASLDNIKLSKKNQQLQEALLKLRDVMKEQEANYLSEIEVLKQDASSVRNMTLSNDDLHSKLKDAEDIIEDLRSQLDDALGAEEMIESLSEKNMELTEQCEELLRTIEELETLKALNDELEQDHVDTEKQLMQELEELEALHHANEQKLNESEERNSYLESAIIKFREVVSTLESDLEELRANNQLINADSAAMAVHTKSLLDLNMKLSNTALEVNSKTMDLQLRKFQAEQSTGHLSIVKCYLSDGYSKDETSVEALLRLERISFTSHVIQDFLFSRLESSTSNLIPIIQYSQILLALMDIQRYASAMAYFVRFSTPELFQSFASLYSKTEFVEKMLSAATEVLKKDDLQEQEFSKELENALPKLWVYYDECLKDFNKKEPAYVLVLNDLQQIQHTHTFLRDLFSAINLLLMQQAAIDGSSNPVFTGISDQMSAFARTKILAAKLTKDVIAAHDESQKILKPEILAQISSVKTKCKLLVQFLTATLQQLRESLAEHESSDSAILDDSTALTQEQVISVFKEQFYKVFSEDSTEMNNNITLKITNEFQAIITQLKALSAIEQDSFVDQEVLQSPWSINATKLKELLAVQAEKDSEISNLKNQLQKLSTTLRSRDKSIEELEVKVGLLNSKMDKSKEQAQVITDLRNALVDAGAQEKKLKETVHKLRQSLLDQEKYLTTKWKKQAGAELENDLQMQQQSEQSRFDNMSAAAMQHEINSLRKTVNYLSRLQNVSLDGQKLPETSPRKQQSILGDAVHNSWLDKELGATVISVFQSPSANKLRQKYRGTLSDVRKSLSQFEILSIKRPSAPGVDPDSGKTVFGTNSSSWVSRKNNPSYIVTCQKDVYEKVRLIIHQLAIINL